MQFLKKEREKVDVVKQSVESCDVLGSGSVRSLVLWRSDGRRDLWANFWGIQDFGEICLISA